MTDTNANPTVLPKFRAFMAGMGVDLSPPKNIYFNDQLGMLMVRATLKDLDAIEQALQVINTSSPQVTIEVKFAEVKEDEEGGKDFLKILGLKPGALKPTPITPDIVPALRPDSVQSSNLPPAGFFGILAADQFRTVLKALEERRGVDLLSAPRVTTVSGRQAEIKISNVRYVVTGLQAFEDARKLAPANFEAPGIWTQAGYRAARRRGQSDDSNDRHSHHSRIHGL